MERQVKCECGYVARGETDDEVVEKIRSHIASDHPELMDKISDSDIRGWIEVIG